MHTNLHVLDEYTGDHTTLKIRIPYKTEILHDVYFTFREMYSNSKWWCQYTEPHINEWYEAKIL